MIDRRRDARTVESFGGLGLAVVEVEFGNDALIAKVEADAFGFPSDRHYRLTGTCKRDESVGYEERIEYALRLSRRSTGPVWFYEVTKIDRGFVRWGV